MKEGKTQPKTAKAPKIPVRQKCIQSARRDCSEPSRGKGPLLRDKPDLVSSRALAFEVVAASTTSLIRPQLLAGGFFGCSKDGRRIREPLVGGVMCGAEVCRKGVQGGHQIRRHSLADFIWYADKVCLRSKIDDGSNASLGPHSGGVLDAKAAQRDGQRGLEPRGVGNAALDQITKAQFQGIREACHGTAGSCMRDGTHEVVDFTGV